MKSNRISLALLGALMLFIASCSNKANIPVPKDAGVVIHINGASLSSKLSWDEVKQGEWFKMASKEAKDELAQKILNNPEESGVDIKSDAYIFFVNRGNGGYAGVVCGIKDEKKFEDFLSSIRKGDKIEKKDGLSMLTDNDNVLTWKDNRMVFIGDNPDMNPGTSAFGLNKQKKRFETDSLLFFAKEVYDIKGSKSIGSDSKFANVIKDGGDVHFWVNTGKIYGNALPALLSLTKASLLFEGNISAATIDFENGKIAVKSKNYFNKELGALYKKYSMRSIDEDMLKKIPAGEVAAVIAMNYPPEGLKDFITLLGVDGIVNAFLAEAGFSIQDFVKANKGDLLFAVSDFTVGQKEVSIPMGEGAEPYTYKTTQPDAKILFGTSISDMPSFEKLMNILKETITKQGGQDMSAAVNKIPYQIKGNWFVAGSDSGYINSFGATQTNHPFIDKIKGHSMVGFIDIQKFIAGANMMYSSDSTAASIAAESMKVWKDMVFYSGNYKNESIEGYFEINMVDQNTNSLKQLNNYFSFIATKFLEQEKRREEEYKNRWNDEGVKSE